MNEHWRIKPRPLQEFIGYLAAPSLNSPRASDEYAHSGTFDWPADETCELMVELTLGPVAAVAVEREAALQWQLDSPSRCSGYLVVAGCGSRTRTHVG